MRPLPGSAVRLLRQALAAGERALRAAASGLDLPDGTPGTAGPDAEAESEETCARFRETTLWLRITKSEVRFRGTNSP